MSAERYATDLIRLHNGGSVWCNAGGSLVRMGMEDAASCKSSARKRKGRVHEPLSPFTRAVEKDWTRQSFVYNGGAVVST